MSNFESIFKYVLALLLFSGIQSKADTFVVTNLNDPGAGSLREAIDNSNSNPGPDKIVFSEGLSGTITLSLGILTVTDNLQIRGPGPDRITIDADNKTRVFVIKDSQDSRSIAVKIIGLELINGNDDVGGAIVNFENLTIDSCILRDNSAILGGAIQNIPDGPSAIIARLHILNSEFVNNQAEYGGAIQNNGSTIEIISNTIFSGNTSTESAGAIRNEQGTIKEISNCTFNNNSNSGVDSGGAVANNLGLIEKIINCTFSHNNSDFGGGAISDGGEMNISFTTFADNQAATGGAIEGGSSTRIRNSIIAFNTPDNCSVSISDFGGNYSDNSTCGFTGDNAEILLGPLMDNGGPTETMALLGGDPVDGATVNCDALDEDGNPTGIPIGIDQRYFPRPFGAMCDSGSFETQPTASVTITKVTDPSGGTGFGFVSDGFGNLEGCGLRGDGGDFIMNDGESVNCTVPEGDYSITENIPPGYELIIFCLEAPGNLTINNETGEISFTIEGPGSDVDCIYTNTRTGGGNGGCSLAPAGANYTFPLYLFAPALILMRRFYKKCRG